MSDLLGIQGDMAELQKAGFAIVDRLNLAGQALITQAARDFGLVLTQTLDGPATKLVDHIFSRLASLKLNLGTIGPFDLKAH